MNTARASEAFIPKSPKSDLRNVTDGSVLVEEISFNNLNLLELTQEAGSPAFIAFLLLYVCADICCMLYEFNVNILVRLTDHLVM